MFDGLTEVSRDREERRSTAVRKVEDLPVGVNSVPKRTSKKLAKVAKEVAAKRVAAKPTLLSGGNPQIAKADGDAPVQTYIAAMPGWMLAGSLPR
jgi:hypothetical protein